VSVGFLQRIVVATRAELLRPEYLEQLPGSPGRRPPSLRQALEAAHERGALIAEYKRRSPGAALPELPVRSFDTFVQDTSDATVEAYSCLASRPEFGGSPGDVAALASRTARPVLFKDFVIDPVQLDAATRAGASAVLLIARLETEGLLSHSLRSLAEGAHDRGLEVLLEWHGRAELRRTEGVPADVYGVNVRDLDSLEVHRSVAEETIRAAEGFRPLIGMSGVEGPTDAQRFWQAGLDGILVGSALSRASDPPAFLASLRRPSGGGGA
jgi:indole-3-glycerol phosphate synthase